MSYKTTSFGCGAELFCLKYSVYILSAALGGKRLEDEADSWGAERSLVLVFDY